MTANRPNILKTSGWPILAVLSFIPAIFWAFGVPVALRLSTFSLLSKSLGDVAGLCGMAMFSLVMVLSARPKFLEKFFKGMNDAYIAHHFFGGLALCLLLFHPLLLAYNYLQISFNGAALFLLPSENLTQNFGILGLFVMIVTLVITFYTKLKYQVWKFTHQFLGLAFIFAFLHTFFVGADIAQNPALKIYLFILGIAGIASFFYRTLFGKYLVKNFDLVVKSIELLPDRIWEIEFKTLGKEMEFLPGQFVFLKIFSKALSSEPHPFSISSAPGQPLKIAIKELGDYTNNIGKVKIGDKASAEGPFGAFSFLNHENKKQIWIAGGVGITPFMGMARSLNQKTLDYKIDLYFSVKDENCLCFTDEIEEIFEKYENVKILLWTSSQMGFINAKSVIAKTPDIAERDILICGPPVMMASLKKQFLEQGIDKNKIFTEEFQLY